MVLQSFLPECQIAAAGTAWPRTSLRRGWNSFITDFPDSKQISRICSVRARDSTPDEPGRSFFGNNPGKLLAPDRDWCARHQEHRPGSWSAAAYALRKIREIGFHIREIRDDAVPAAARGTRSCPSDDKRRAHAKAWMLLFSL